MSDLVEGPNNSPNAWRSMSFLANITQITLREESAVTTLEIQKSSFSEYHSKIEEVKLSIIYTTCKPRNAENRGPKWLKFIFVSKPHKLEKLFGF